MLVHVVPPDAKASKKGHKRFRDASGAMFGDVSGPPSARSFGHTQTHQMNVHLEGRTHLQTWPLCKVHKALQGSQYVSTMPMFESNRCSCNLVYACSSGSSRQSLNERPNWADVEPSLGPPCRCFERVQMLPSNFDCGSLSTSQMWPNMKK